MKTNEGFKEPMDFQKVAAKVGDLLGYQQEAHAERLPSANVILVGPGDKTLFLSSEWAGPGRVYVVGRLPLKEGDYSSKVSITVAATATPEKIARAIELRLLPAYLTELAEAKDLLKRQGDRAAWTEARLRKFEKREDSVREGTRGVCITRGDLSVSVKVGFEPDDMRLDLRAVPERLALKIVALVRANTPMKKRR